MLPLAEADSPMLLCSDPFHATDRISATEVKDFLLKLAGPKGARP